MISLRLLNLIGLNAISLAGLTSVLIADFADQKAEHPEFVAVATAQHMTFSFDPALPNANALFEPLQNTGPPPAPPEEPTFRLVGIVLDGERSVAVVSSPEMRARKLHVGEMLGPWKLARLSDKSAEFTWDRRAIELKLWRAQ